MYIKFLKHGLKGGKSCKIAMNYCKDGHNNTSISSEILRGDPRLIADCADSLSFSQKYKSMVVGFHINDKPSTLEIEKFIDDLEKHAFPSLKEDQFSTVWFQHKDTQTGKIDLHMITPCCELSTGKYINIAPPRSLKYFDLVRDFYNLKNNWKSPDIEKYPVNKRNTTFAHIPAWNKDKRSFIQSINSFVENAVINELIQNRADIVSLFKESGFEVTRQSFKSISIKSSDMKRAIRLTGGLYEREAKLSAEIIIKQNGAIQRNRTSDKESIGELERRMHQARTRRGKYNQERYNIDAKNTSDFRRSTEKKVYENNKESTFSNILEFNKNGGACSQYSIDTHDHNSIFHAPILNEHNSGRLHYSTKHEYKVHAMPNRKNAAERKLDIHSAEKNIMITIQIMKRIIIQTMKLIFKMDIKNERDYTELNQALTTSKQNCSRSNNSSIRSHRIFQETARDIKLTSEATKRASEVIERTNKSFEKSNFRVLQAINFCKNSTSFSTTNVESHQAELTND